MMAYAIGAGLSENRRNRCDTSTWTAGLVLAAVLCAAAADTIKGPVTGSGLRWSSTAATPARPPRPRPPGRPAVADPPERPPTGVTVAHGSPGPTSPVCWRDQGRGATAGHRGGPGSATGRRPREACAGRQIRKGATVRRGPPDAYAAELRFDPKAPLPCCSYDRRRRRIPGTRSVPAVVRTHTPGIVCEPDGCFP